VRLNILIDDDMQDAALPFQDGLFVVHGITVGMFLLAVGGADGALNSLFENLSLLQHTFGVG